MRKNKKIIIIFSLILSLLFLNITPVYCSQVQFSFSDAELTRTVENPILIVINNNTDATLLTHYYNHNGGSYNFMLSDNLDDDYTYTIKFFDGETLLYLDTNFVPSNRTYYLLTGSTYSQEKPEDTETPTTPPSSEEESTPPLDVVIDNTEVVAELKEIKSYLLMFYASFFMYFGYKIIKETVNKQRR